MFKKIVIVSSAMLSIERPPASLAFLAGVCEHNQIDYEIFDFNLFLLEKFGHERWKNIGNMFSTVETITGDDEDLLREIDEVVTRLDIGTMDELRLVVKSVSSDGALPSMLDDENQSASVSIG